MQNSGKKMKTIWKAIGKRQEILPDAKKKPTLSQYATMMP